MSLKKALALLLLGLRPKQAQGPATASALTLYAEQWAQDAKRAVVQHAAEIAAAVAAAAGEPVDTKTVARALDSGVADVVRGAQAQYQDAGDDPEKQQKAFASFDWRAKQLAVSVTQQTKVNAFQRASTKRGKKVIRDGGTCPKCVSLQGEYSPDNPDCWWTHPSCTCEWSVQETADMSGNANFAVLNAKKRDAIDDSDFAGPNRTFPVPDQAHADNAASRVAAIKDAGLRARIEAGIRRICKRKGLKVPPSLATADHAAGEESEGIASFAGMASFADGEREERDGYAVYPRALVWRAGDYPDKQYTMDREDNLIAATNFAEPVPINIEHTPFLQGRAGELRSLYVDDADPDLLRGEVAIPLWLDTQLDPRERQLSVGWDRPTKMPDHLGLTTSPRVMGMALMSMAQEAAGMNGTADFAPRGMSHNTAHGQYAIQDIHDAAVRHGATCNPPANMASRHEANAIQQAHDLATQHGATCEGQGQAGRPIFSAGTGSQEGKHMSVKEKLIALFGGNVSAEEQAEIDRIVDRPATFSVESDPAFVAMQAEVRTERAKRITSEATGFADGLIREGRATTAEREALIAKFSRAATDDYEHGTANFSGFAESHSRVEELRAQEGSRPQQFAQARPQPGQSVVLDPHHSNPATFSGDPQLTEEEEKAQREEALNAVRQTDAYKNLKASFAKQHN
jgi:hypothetical protein